MTIDHRIIDRYTGAELYRGSLSDCLYVREAYECPDRYDIRMIPDTEPRMFDMRITSLHPDALRQACHVALERICSGRTVRVILDVNDTCRMDPDILPWLVGMHGMDGAPVEAPRTEQF